ncbi:LiaF transmembrane domain-containing protein [Paenibacillus beijingensis]|uniref:LiaF transmembrane domain-containing protein n=1 Tax=Paenibacillus beijingensis TaxID=1126833 RepID=A0A0D5NEL3_9BACL|nr:hypothetical protein [Paenibacillus beijingensis]AJY73819.1 hypothetical protein VN24_03195 [Paenibacillus beijingensis]
MNRNTGFGALLIVVGALIAMKFLGLGHLFGWIFGLLFPVILIGLGVVGWRNGSKVIGTVLAVIGALMLLAKLSGLIMLLLAVGLIVWGVSKIKGQRRTY